MLQRKKLKVNPHRDINIVVPTVCALSKIDQLIHQIFGHVYIVRLKLMAIKVLVEGLP